MDLRYPKKPNKFQPKGDTAVAKPIPMEMSTPDVNAAPKKKKVRRPKGFRSVMEKEAKGSMVDSEQEMEMGKGKGPPWRKKV